MGSAGLPPTYPMIPHMLIYPTCGERGRRPSRIMIPHMGGLRLTTDDGRFQTHGRHQYSRRAREIPSLTQRDARPKSIATVFRVDYTAFGTFNAYASHRALRRCRPSPAAAGAFARR